jgi:hypothetical protein
MPVDVTLTGLLYTRAEGQRLAIYHLNGPTGLDKFKNVCFHSYFVLFMLNLVAPLV